MPTPCAWAVALHPACVVASPSAPPVSSQVLPPACKSPYEAHFTPPPRAPTGLRAGTAAPAPFPGCMGTRLPRSTSIASRPRNAVPFQTAQKCARALPRTSVPQCRLSACRSPSLPAPLPCDAARAPSGGPSRPLSHLAEFWLLCALRSAGSCLCKARAIRSAHSHTVQVGPQAPGRRTPVQRRASGVVPHVSRAPHASRHWTASFPLRNGMAG